MKNLAWNDNYLIGCELVDEEHKKLFEISNRAFKAVLGKEKVSKIKTIVHELIEYTQTHFKDEEDFMQRISYPSIKEHKTIHQHIITSMNKFLKTINQKDINEIEKELAHFINQWFISHIIHEDKKIAKWAYTLDAKPSMAWKNIYKIGYDDLDEDHKKFFKIMNEFYGTSISLSNKEHLYQTIDTLLEYLQNHFQKEETFMQSLNFNELEEHKGLHVKLLKDLASLAENTNISLETLNNSFLNFVEKALFIHLQKEDIKIGNWIKFLSELEVSQELPDIE